MIKLDVGLMNNNGKPLKQPVRRVIRSLNHFINLINQRTMATELREEVLNVAKGYPEGALDYVYHNIDAVIQQCALKLRRPQEVVENTEPTVSLPPEPSAEKPVKPQAQKKALFDDGATWEGAATEKTKSVELPPLPPKKTAPLSSDEYFAKFRAMIPDAIDPQNKKSKEED